MNRAVRRMALLVLIVATVGCDRVTKRVATDRLADSPSRSFAHDTVRLQYAENAGGFLGLGADWPVAVRTSVFTAGNAVLLVALIVVAVRERWSDPGLTGVALFAAGGVSNLVDRIARGSVVDFMNVGVGDWRTGIFNVADVAIMLGMALAAFEFLRPRRGSHR